MLNFIADPRDGYSYQNACSVCCCTEIRMKPGETNLLRINYAGWVIPLMGRGLTINTWTDVTKITPDAESGGNAAPNLSLAARFNGPANAPITDDLTAYVADADGGPLTFKLLAIYGPNHGTMTVNSDGTFTYTPQTGYNGLDTFYYEVSDGFNKRVGFGAFGIGSGAALLTPIPDKVSVLTSRKKIDPHDHSLSLPIVVDPTALPGDIYRVNIRQEAIDCDGNTFYHTSCYDIIIGKC